VKDLGADAVIDHTSVDLATIDEQFDVVLDAVGNLSIASGRPLLRDGGVLLLVVADLWQTVRAHGDVRAGVSPERVADFDQLLALVAAGDLTVVLDRDYDLDDIAEAHRHVDTGHKVGNIVVRPG
jgi:NADPH:quinone reductase-like Zn-dependent oxidoreductase